MTQPTPYNLIDATDRQLIDPSWIVTVNDLGQMTHHPTRIFSYAIVHNPDLFVQVILKVYRPAGERVPKIFVEWMKRPTAWFPNVDLVVPVERYHVESIRAKQVALRSTEQAFLDDRDLMVKTVSVVVHDTLYTFDVMLSVMETGRHRVVRLVFEAPLNEDHDWNNGYQDAINGKLHRSGSSTLYTEGYTAGQHVDEE